MARLGGVKTILISLAIGAVIVGLLYAIEHLNLTGREPITVDIAALSRDDERKPLLASHTQEFSCEPEKSDLGKTICWTEIESFNGIPARYLAYFFDKDNRLTAFKLAAYSRAHQQIIEAFSARFGEPRQAADAPFLAWPTGGGVLTLAAQKPETTESPVLWVNDPEVVRAFDESPRNLDEAQRNSGS